MDRKESACTALRRCADGDRLQWEDLHEAELKVFVWLEFSLHVPATEVMPHLHRIVKDLGMPWQEIGEAGCLPRSSDEDVDASLRDYGSSFY
ncbi:cchl [Symbiodinium pilosum]|uniref:Cchl protein n=1 Tax=Symbiodinium pilosum TaxID=2952 RepID=A0A812KPJ1_SYMPI|nr:cchl [Symbiodinium pilosum]